jgi:predicted NBD/HSP70 family sugar kinase
MPAELPGHEFSAAQALGKTDTRPVAHLRQERAVRFVRRLATRLAWYEHPVVRLRHIAEDDALIVEILPLEPAADRLVDDLLCIEFDGTDSEAFPTSLCLTGFTALPESAAAQAARHLLGETLCRAADEMVSDGVAERAVPLDESVRDSRVRAWRRLTGLAIGIEVLPGELRAVLVGADGEIMERERRPQQAMSPEAVAAGVAALADDLCRRHRFLIVGSEVHLGVQIGGPVDATSGVVHHFHKRDRAGRLGYAWEDEPLGDMLEHAIGLRTHVLNDVVGYATYERWFHPAPDERCRAVLLISQGVGAKLIINGNVAIRMPMEIGNMILHEDGAPCECGKRGCLEATAGTQALVDTVRTLTGRPVTDIDDAVELAEPEAGRLDAGIVDIFLAAGRDIARGIGIVQVIANPASWAIYGPAALLTKGSHAGDAFLQSLEDFPRWVSYDGFRKCRVERRPIAGDEGAHGAALAVLEHFGISSPVICRRPNGGSG